MPAEVDPHCSAAQRSLGEMCWLLSRPVLLSGNDLDATHHARLANIMACSTPTGAGGPRAVCRPAMSLADCTLAADPQQEEQQRPEHPNLPNNAYIDTQHAQG